MCHSYNVKKQFCQHKKSVRGMNSPYCLNVLAFSVSLLGAGPFQEQK